MPVILPNGLPANERLLDENIFVMSPDRARTQDIRPLRILALNLMPTKSQRKRRLPGCLPIRRCR